MKVLGLVAGCHECPNKSYYSGGQYVCAKANAPLPFNQGPNQIPEWCPLADYPARAMGRLSEENAALRRQLEQRD
ncbi:hypothetical protein ACXR8U_14015 [Methylobacterium radiotolerans]|jgi:hypothetical protein|uniref:hypothetical protein n=1 Tax=Methylobacterium TaxID=407 RepID=UPI0005DB8AC8|nr:MULTISPECIES: hypothetical protein [Methylobacterium]MBN6821707.1 hypothetical protein [Methylobacterium organophilum]GAN49655.1 putative athila transposon protein [Methylobacterium sp. ME121]